MTWKGLIRRKTNQPTNQPVGLFNTKSVVFLQAKSNALSIYNNFLTILYPRLKLLFYQALFDSH